MNKNIIDLILIFTGLLGMIIIAWISIEDSHATDIVSAIPVQLLFVSLFMSGYISYRKTD